MDRLSSLRNSEAFIYPYTTWTGDDIDSVVTASLIYDKLLYLDYVMPGSDSKPIYQGLDQEPAPVKLAYHRVLASLETHSVLSGIQAQEVREIAFRDSQDFTNQCMYYISRLRDLGFSSRAIGQDIRNIYLADQKIDDTLRDALEAGGFVRASELGQTLVSWEAAAGILAAYAECIWVKRKSSPLGLDEFHAEALLSALGDRLANFHEKARENAERRLGTIFEFSFPSLENTCELDLGILHRVRTETREPRIRALQSLATECANGNIEDCKEAFDEMRDKIHDLAGKNYSVTRKLRIFGYAASAITGAFLPPGLLSFFINLIPGGFVEGSLLAKAKIDEREIAQLRKHPYYYPIMLVDEMKKLGLH